MFNYQWDHHVTKFMEPLVQALWHFLTGQGVTLSDFPSLIFIIVFNLSFICLIINSLDLYFPIKTTKEEILQQLKDNNKQY
jgi:hypothetical protein